MSISTSPLRASFLRAGVACALGLALCGCGLGPRGADLADAEEAMRRGDNARAIELIVPHQGREEAADLLLARARCGLARSLFLASPDDPAALRMAFDQIALALPLAAADPSLQAELLSLQVYLVGQLERGDVRGVAAAPLPTTAPELAPDTPTAPPPRAEPEAAAARPTGSTPLPAMFYGVAERRSYEGSGTFASARRCGELSCSGRSPMTRPVLPPPST